MDIRRLEICVCVVVALFSAAVLASFVNDMKTGVLASAHWFLAHLSFIAVLLLLGDWILIPVRREAERNSEFGILMYLGGGVLAFVFVCNAFVA